MIPVYPEVLGGEGVVHPEGKVTYNGNGKPLPPEYTDQCILLQGVKDTLPFLDGLIWKEGSAINFSTLNNIKAALEHNPGQYSFLENLKGGSKFKMLMVYGTISFK